MSDPPSGDGEALLAMLDALPERIARYRMDDLLVVYCNAAKARDHGLEAHQLIGRPLGEVLPAAEVAALRHDLARLGPDDRSATAIRRGPAPAHHQMWIEWSDQWLPGGDTPEVLSVGRDVTGRHDAELRLHDSEQRFRLAMADAPIGMAIVGPDARFIAVNQALCTFLDRPEAELLELTTLDVTHPEDRADDLAYGQASARGVDHPGVQKRFVRPDGSWVTGLLKISTVLDDQGRPSYVIGQVVDITDQMAQTQRLEENARAERRVADRLRRLDEVKNSFLTAVSHELRTPLTVVRGMAATLTRVDARLDEGTRAELEAAIDRHATDLSELLDELLDVDRLARGALTADPQRLELVGVCRRMIADSRVDDRVELVAPRELWSTVDVVQFERILSNLLDNAGKYAPHGAIEVRLSSDRVHLRLEVRDHGPGIPAEDLDRVFEPFYRGDDRHPQPGTGVGLALVAEFARLHDGRAWAEPTSRGAHIVVEIPDGRIDDAVGPH